jgi:hypothetical protein
MANQDRGLGGYVLLVEDANPLRAHLIAGALDEAGIPHVVEEDNLADEFAMSRKLMNTQGARVMVPEDRLAEAQAIFLAMSQPIPVIDEEDPEMRAYEKEYEKRQRRALGAISLVLIAGGVSALILWLAQRNGWGPF